ncbi:hypothetical protein NC651_030368 [Populus alba x Populus x berolinensis]|nr:hypothetical protein NC651_030368 [Populus alba x Populus x berolinensis]
MLSRVEAYKVLNCCAGSSSFDSLQMWKGKSNSNLSALCY